MNDHTSSVGVGEGVGSALAVGEADSTGVAWGVSLASLEGAASA